MAPPSKSARAHLAHAARFPENAEDAPETIVFAPPFKRKIDGLQALK
jgi:hypothetical protein